MLTAYDELKARGVIAGRRGAGMRIVAPGGVRGFDLRRLLREAQYPARTITVTDPDGNAISVGCRVERRLALTCRLSVVRGSRPR